MSGQMEIMWGEVAELTENSVLDWKELKVDDIKADYAHALSTGPFGSAISSKFFLESGFPVIRGANLSQNVSERFSDDGLVFISPEKAQEFRRSIVRKGDLIFTCWGTINQVGLIDGKSKYGEYVISNKQMKLTPDPKKADPYFLYYLFSSPDYQSRILNNDIGSTIPGFNLGQLKKMEMLLPSVFEQHAITGVLSSLDDKIDLLNRQNATLEALAETLYRQWFAEEAKEEWEEKELGEVTSIGIGRTPPRKEHHWFSTSPADVKWISIKDMGQVGAYIFNTSEFLTDQAVERFKVPVIPRDTVVLSFKMTVGRVAITTEPMLSNEAIAHFKFSTKTPFTKEYLYLYLKTYKYETLGSTSSIVTSINSAMIKEMKILIPDEGKMMQFQAATETYFNKMRHNQTQIQTLSNLRDTLLPKLMSGEVRVAY